MDQTLSECEKSEGNHNQVFSRNLSGNTILSTEAIKNWNSLGGALSKPGHWKGMNTQTFEKGKLSVENPPVKREMTLVPESVDSESIKM